MVATKQNRCESGKAHIFFEKCQNMLKCSDHSSPQEPAVFTVVLVHTSYLSGPGNPQPCIKGANSKDVKDQKDDPAPRQ
jgi:hypothetical protein